MSRRGKTVIFKTSESAPGKPGADRVNFLPYTDQLPKPTYTPFSMTTAIATFGLSYGA
jgi:hypothetical protein